MNSNINDLSMVALVALYNHLSDSERVIKKFENRSIALARVAAVIDNLPDVPKAEEKAAAKAEEKVAKAAAKAEEKAAKAAAKAEEKAAKAAAKAAKAPKVKKSAEERAASIARSWLDADVAARRAKRDGCIVDGVWYKSVPAAFRELGLPMGKMIKVRLMLKESGSMELMIPKGDDLVNSFWVLEAKEEANAEA